MLMPKSCRLYAKDFAVAAHLMLLWRDMYPSATGKRSNDRSTWGRPAQFVDLGAGNGLRELARTLLGKADC